MSCRTFIPIFFIVAFIVEAKCNFNPFMDSIYFAIEWPGPNQELLSADNALTEDDGLSVVMTTKNMEKYRCIIPSVPEADNRKDDGPIDIPAFEMDLLKPLFSQTACTYRLEMYWTYELCHGKHLRQYHEDKELGKKSKLTEYFLGRYDTEKFKQDYTQKKTEHDKNIASSKESHKKKKVQGVEIPYYEILFGDGTFCDLTGLPRRAAIHYVCQPDGRGEIYELKETSSCEYEVIVLTHLLCSHPIYGPKKEVINTIHCHSLDGAPQRPFSDVATLDSSRDEYNSREFWKFESAEDEEPDEDEEPPPKPEPPRPHHDDEKFKHIGDHTDKEFVKNFITGEECIHGGSGWWKYEFCYGKHVKQYHEDRFSKTVILLGEWNTKAHLLWIMRNHKKRPESLGLRRSLHHFYGNGDICDLTGLPRNVEVKLACVTGANNAHAMGIYLVEPKPCQYRLVVESPLLCSIINMADDDGLVKIPEH